MTSLDQPERQFNLEPHPRILPMLGEIRLDQWRCLAELIDNSVDAFLAAQRAGHPVNRPEVLISIPRNDHPGGKVVVRDNAGGMDPETLENAVRAGWTSNDPINNLGLFGMGFNIATARLGSVTRVWSTRRGDPLWHGLVIDFEALIRQRSFRTPMITRPKNDPLEAGTEVWIENLKPEQRQYFARTANHSRIVKELGRAYSAMLRPNGAPLSFRLSVNGPQVRGRNHCVWGADGVPREVGTARYGVVNAFQTIDRSLGERQYCVRCWEWLGRDEATCPSCGSGDHLVTRSRRVKGWIGIQRYLDENDYGVDFLRNGRKIETANRDLFFWDSGEGLQEEYPIDDPRHRGRIVGEIHLDHCRVNYTKDRFDRNDPAWEEMVQLVRGDGPLRPELARQSGVQANASPLFLLYQAFRRSSPRPKIAGCYAKLLLVPDNEHSREMARRFHNGEAEYQTDAKWWEIVDEADQALLITPTGAGTGGSGGGDIPPEDFWGENGGGGGAMLTDSAPIGEDASTREPDPPVREPLSSLGREYREELTNLRWVVEAFSVFASDPELSEDGRPWRLRATPSGPFQFFVNTRHLVFGSATLTPLDALLVELAWSTMDATRGPRQPVFAAVLSGLRERYGGSARLDPVELSSAAGATLRSVARSLSRDVDGNGEALWAELSHSEQEAALTRMTSRAGADHTRLISEGRFLEFAPRQTLLRFFALRPELFFDGRYWDVTFADLDFGHREATREAKARLVRYYAGLLDDALWLAENDPEDLSESSRGRLLRAALSLELLASDVVNGNGE